MTTQNTNVALRKPVHTFRDRVISVRIWKNEHTHPETGESNTFYSIDMKRSYKTDAGWKTTTSINGDDAFRVANLFTSANAWIMQQEFSNSLPSTVSVQPAQESGQ